MNEPLIRFTDCSFFYLNNDAPEQISDITAEDITMVFQELDLELPAGVLSIIGENGIGKSTLMQLASARLFPVRGSVSILGHDTSKYWEVGMSPELEIERNALASVIYQNMEFESEENLGDMLETIFAAGQHEAGQTWVLDEAKHVFELQDDLKRRFSELSKGAMQRALMAIGTAFGSSILFMDEPVFALEDRQKEKSLEYLQDYSHRTARSLIFSAHNIHLCRDYADNCLLMRKDGNLVLGDAGEVCQKDVLEAAYEVPMDFLHKKEQLYRDMLTKKAGL